MDQGDEARLSTAGVGAARAYEMVRKELMGEFGADFFRSYIDPLRLVAEMDGVLLFRAGSRVAQERLRQQVQHRLEARMRVYVPDLPPTRNRPLPHSPIAWAWATDSGSQRQTNAAGSFRSWIA